MHNIMKTMNKDGNEIYAMGSNRTTSWHGLGQYINKDNLTSSEMLEASCLDWTVEKIPLQVHDAVNDNFTEVPNSYGTFRRENVYEDGIKIGTQLVPLTRNGNMVAGVYTILQNVDAFAFLDELLGDNTLEVFETAGALGNGEKVWILVKIPTSLKMGKTGKDVIEPYICFTNTHDGTGSVQGFLTTVRVVCQNTLNMALGSQKGKNKTRIKSDGTMTKNSVAASGSFYIRHTSKVMDRVAVARDGLGLILEEIKVMEVGINKMVNTKMTKKQTTEWFADALDAKVGKKGELTTASKRIMEASVKALNHPTNKVDGMKGTAWAAYNALSYTLDHTEVQWNSGIKKGTNSEKKIESTVFGKVADKKELAFRMLVDRCENHKYVIPKIKG